MRRYLWLILLPIVLLGNVAVRGQQMYQFSQYMFNTYLVNPAIVGTYNYYQIRLNSRFQWIGIDDAPITNSVSVYGPHAKLPMGFGGIFYNDMTGPTLRNGLMGTYSYNFRLNDEMRLSAALSLGFTAYTIDATKFDLGDNFNAEGVVDPALMNYTSKTKVLPDASLGLYLYATFFYVGLSAHQLFMLPTRFYSEAKSRIELKPHIYVMAGYMVYLYDYLELEPAVLLKYSYPSPFQFEVNLKLTYNNMVWGGLAYRFNDAVAVLAGYKWNNRVLIGYSFDFSYTSLLRYNYGTHELVLGYQFDKIK